MLQHMIHNNPLYHLSNALVSNISHTLSPFTSQVYHRIQDRVNDGFNRSNSSNVSMKDIESRKAPTSNPLKDIIPSSKHPK